LYHLGSDDDGATWAYDSLGGPLATRPTAVSWGPGRIDVFSGYGDNPADIEVQHQWYDAQGWSGWRPWADLDGPVMLSDPLVTSPGSGRLDLYYRRADYKLESRHFANGGWGNWVDRGPVPARPTEAPAAVSLDNGTMVILVRNELGNAPMVKTIPAASTW
jgi:hypothetical protein